MAKLLKLRRGTTTQHGSFTGAEGEVTVDTDKETLVVHDGSTAGGHAVAAEDMANVSSANILGRLGTGSVVKAKLEADIIDSTKLADDSVNSEHYVDGSIDTAHIADLQVTTAKIAADAITGAKIADDQIDSEHYVDGSIDTAHIADANVTHVKLANDCIDGDNIQDDVVNSEHIAAGAVDLEHMSSQSVDEDNLHISNTGADGQFLSKQSGNAGGLTWATVSTTASAVSVNANNSTDETCYPLFVDGAIGAQGPESDTDLNYNPSTGLLTSAAFSGSGASLTTLNGSNISSGTVAAARVATLNQNTTGSSGSCTGNAAGLTGSPNITVGTIGCGNVTGTGTISDSIGNVRIAPILTATSGDTTLTAAMAGKVIYTNQHVIVPRAGAVSITLGSMYTVINTWTNNINIQVGSGSGIEFYIANDTTLYTSNRTLAPKGLVTILYVSDQLCYLSGSGIS